MAGKSYRRFLFTSGSTLGLIVMVCLLVWKVSLHVVASSPPELPLGKETTYVTGPLDEEGYIYYETALNERLRQGIKPEANANVLLWQAWGPRPEGSRMPERFYEWLGIPEPPEEGDYFVGLWEYLRDTAKVEPEAIESLSQQLWELRQQPWLGQSHSHIEGWLRVNDKPLALVIEATKRPQYYNPLVSRQRGPGNLIDALLPGPQKCREVQLALVRRAQLRMKEGKYAEGWQDLLAAHRLARHIARGGTSIELVVGAVLEDVACQGHLSYLEDGRLTAEQLRGFLKDVQGLPPLPPYADKVELTERLICLDCIQRIRRGDELPGNEKMPAHLEGMERIVWEPALRNINQGFDRIVAALRLSHRAEREKALEEIAQELEALAERSRPSPIERLLAPIQRLWRDPRKYGAEVGIRIGNITIGLFVSAIQKVQQTHDRGTQRLRNLQVALALAIYQREHGRYPARLEELAPRYLPAVPDDLFTGQPLIYRRTEGGYVLYSVGVNGRDDEGRTYGEVPPGDDLVVRLPLSEPKPKNDE